MLETRIINDMNANYLLITSDEITGSGYEHKMFEYNNIKGFLSFAVSRINNNITYQYKIMEYESLTKAFYNKSFSIGDIKNIFSAITMAGQQAAEYLLNTDSILLNPEYIFVNREEMFFCYYPGNGLSFNRGIRELMEYILERLDHKNQENVMVAYGLYQKVLKNNFTMEMLMEEFTKPKEMNVQVSGGRISLGEKVKANQDMPDKKEQYRQRLELKEQAKEGLNSSWNNSLDKNEVSADTVSGNNVDKLADIITLEEELESGKLLKKEAKKKKDKKIKETKGKQKKGNLLKIFTRKKDAEKDWSEYGSGNTMLLAESSAYGSTQLLGTRRLVNQGDGKDIVLCDFPVYIGNKTGDAQYKIDNIMVSRNHAVITWECGIYYVEDNDSTNGTFVNGSRLSPYEPVQIKEGDIICFANEKYCLN